MNYDPIAMLRDHIIANGPVKTWRVSSAQARGNAKKYAYWGAVRYELRVTKKGAVSNVAIERASSDRRSMDLAFADGKAMARAETRLLVGAIGQLDHTTAAGVLLRCASA